MSNFEITVLSEEDWLGYKTVRLESLLDSPDSFGSTYEREASFAPSQWKSRLKSAPTMHDALAIAAVANNSYIGLLSCVINSSDTKSANLYQMWVSPQYRGLGVGTALFNKVRSWAVVKDIEKMILSVTISNSEAISLYESVGFVPLGIVEPLRAGSDLQSQVMQLKLGTSCI